MASNGRHKSAQKTPRMKQSTYCNNDFQNTWMSQNFDVNWPPRSCDLAPCDFILCGYVESRVYARTKPEIIPEHKSEMQRVSGEVQTAISYQWNSNQIKISQRTITLRWQTMACHRSRVICQIYYSILNRNISSLQHNKNITTPS